MVHRGGIAVQGSLRRGRGLSESGFTGWKDGQDAGGISRGESSQGTHKGRPYEVGAVNA